MAFTISLRISRTATCRSRSSPRHPPNGTRSSPNGSTSRSRTISAEDIDGDGKPAPDIYEHAARVVGCEPEGCLVIEDSQNGLKAGTNAGMDVIAYRSGPNDDTDLSAANTIVESSEALRAEIRSRAGL